jgi:hypothetical protein
MRRLDRILKRIQSTNPRPNAFQIFGSAVTPARDDSYADDTHAQFMRPVRRSASHDKLTSNGILCNGLRAFATRFSLCLSPAGNGSMFPMRGGSSNARARQALKRASALSASGPIP